MITKLKLLISLCLFGLIVGSINSCQNKENRKLSVDSIILSEPPAMNIIQTEESADIISKPAPQASVTEKSYERKLIKTGTLYFETENMEKSRSDVERYIKMFEGYISNDNNSGFTGRNEQKIVIRVPAKNFDSLLDSICSLPEKIENKSIEVKDVTSSYIDMSARVKTKKEFEKRYLELLKVAKKVDDMLAIEAQLGTIREEIESIEGQLKYLDSQAALGTLTLTFYKQSYVEFGFLSQFGNALRSGWDNLLSVFIQFVMLWPYIIAGIIFSLYLYKKIRNRNRKVRPV